MSVIQKEVHPKYLILDIYGLYINISEVAIEI